MYNNKLTTNHFSFDVRYATAEYALFHCIYYILATNYTIHAALLAIIKMYVLLTHTVLFLTSTCAVQNGMTPIPIENRPIGNAYYYCGLAIRTVNNRFIIISLNINLCVWMLFRFFSYHFYFFPSFFFPDEKNNTKRQQFLFTIIVTWFEKTILLLLLGL